MDLLDRTILFVIFLVRCDPVAVFFFGLFFDLFLLLVRGPVTSLYFLRNGLTFL